MSFNQSSDQRYPYKKKKKKNTTFITIIIGLMQFNQFIFGIVLNSHQLVPYKRCNQLQSACKSLGPNFIPNSFAKNCTRNQNNYKTHFYRVIFIVVFD